MTKREVMESERKKKSSELDFEKDISINKFRLDEECLSHASIYYNYGDAQARAKTELAKAKDNLELVQAERNLQIRDELTKNGTKVTESMISSALIIDNEVREAKNEVREAEEVYNRLSVAVQAMEHRKSELDNLVKLYLSGYYSNPNSSDAKNGLTEQAERAVRSNLNKNK